MFEVLAHYASHTAGALYFAPAPGNNLVTLYSWDGQVSFARQTLAPVVCIAPFLFIHFLFIHLQCLSGESAAVTKVDNRLLQRAAGGGQEEEGRLGVSISHVQQRQELQLGSGARVQLQQFLGDVARHMQRGADAASAHCVHLFFCHGLSLT